VGFDLDAQWERLGAPSSWDLWGPWLSERAWGTVREDYSDNGDAWNYLPHDHARSRAYRWSEDGLAGLCDLRQRLCLALAVWNGEDPILKERIFGLTGPEGNHGEDAKEYWWYLDAIPSSSWLKWRYHYPQRAFPYDDLVRVNRSRSRTEPEYELLDTGVFDGDRYWIVEVEYAKAEPCDIQMLVRVRNAGPDAATLHVLPTLWFRNTWTWTSTAAPRLQHDGGEVVADHPELGRYRLQAGSGPDGAPPTLLFCENETNVERLYGQMGITAFPKDGINDHVVAGRPTVNPDMVGSKAAAWYRCEVAGGATVELRLRLVDDDLGPVVEPLGARFDDVHRQRRAEADEFYAEVAGRPLSDDQAAVMRQAFAGMLWGHQYYGYDVDRWLTGDHGLPAPPPGHSAGRNKHWTHLRAHHILSMPDPWEYPWFATWDLAFHAVTIAQIDPMRAKQQLLLFTRDGYQHPNGALPAYEWSFDDVNPPVHAWAALRVFLLDGGRDYTFLARVFHKLLLNFTWWVNRKDQFGNNVFEGGFLGLDNISPLDRSTLPVEGTLEQSDATAWMAAYSLDMFRIAVALAREWPHYQDLALKFLHHFALIASSMQSSGLWEEASAGFYYDRLVTPSGYAIPIRVRSMVGILPLIASAVVPAATAAELPLLTHAAQRFVREHQDLLQFTGIGNPGTPDEVTLLSMVPKDRLQRILQTVFDEGEFLSPHGLRSLSKLHEAMPVTIDVEGVRGSIRYEPAESSSAMFGGNSNWRGPVWFPVNYLLFESMLRYHQFYGDSVMLEVPRGSGRRINLLEAARLLGQRLVGIFLKDDAGRRPVYGGTTRFQTDPEWRDNILFFEYFHGDDGAGLGASHQTGWTGLVGHLLAVSPDELHSFVVTRDEAAGGSADQSDRR
jgi:hypothetical protein